MPSLPELMGWADVIKRDPEITAIAIEVVLRHIPFNTALQHCLSGLQSRHIIPNILLSLEGWKSESSLSHSGSISWHWAELACNNAV